MKRIIIIESDTEFHTLFAYEGTEVKNGVILKGQQIAAEIDRPQFYGQVNRVLVTKDDLKTAAPVEPEVAA